MRNKKLKLLVSVMGIISLLGLMIVGCVSPTSLSVSINSPQDGATLSESPVTVIGVVSGYPRGEVNVGEQTASLSPEVIVNGIRASVDTSGNFSAEVELIEGENTIEAIAMFNDVEARDSITVTYSPSAPALSVEIVSPEDGAELTQSPVTVTGTVSDAGAVVTVNGTEVDVTEDGSFSIEVELTEGENTIIATAISGELQAEDSITVTYTPVAGPTLVSIVVEPASPDELAVGATQQFTATGTYSDDATRDITSEVTWVSSDESVATIDAEGLVTGVAEGTTEITASLSGVNSPAVTLTVVAAVPALSVEITSPQDGAELTQSPVTVTGTVSDTGAVVTVNGTEVEVTEDGSFSIEVELTEGENTITATATSGELQAEDSITVTYAPAAGPTLVSIVIEPVTPDELVVGATLQFTATGTYSDDTTRDITSEVTWVSSDETVAVIDAAGLATGVAEGTTEITASLSGITAPVVTLTVVAS